jgi:hypothetical protein
MHCNKFQVAENSSSWTLSRMTRIILPVTHATNPGVLSLPPTAPFYPTNFLKEYQGLLLIF